MSKNMTAAMWRYQQQNAAVARALNAKRVANPVGKVTVRPVDVRSQVMSLPAKVGFVQRIVQRVRSLV